MDKVTREVRSNTMRAVHSSNSKMEVTFRKSLFVKGIRYRKNVSDLPGKPDIAIKNKKLAVFLDSCFWHGCPQHLRLPQSNRDYWNKKVETNINRDRIISNKYKEMGWKILRLWEHEIKNSTEACIDKLIRNFGDREFMS